MTEEQIKEFEARMEAKTAPRWYGLMAPVEWYEILDRLDKDLEEIIPGYRLLQAKAKFGLLRYYIEPASETSIETSDAYNTRIHQAEREVEEFERSRRADHAN